MNNPFQGHAAGQAMDATQQNHFMAASLRNTHNITKAWQQTVQLADRMAYVHNLKSSLQILNMGGPHGSLTPALGIEKQAWEVSNSQEYAAKINGQLQSIKNKRQQIAQQQQQGFNQINMQQQMQNQNLRPQNIALGNPQFQQGFNTTMQQMQFPMQPGNPMMQNNMQNAMQAGMVNAGQNQNVAQPARNMQPGMQLSPQELAEIHKMAEQMKARASAEQKAQVAAQVSQMSAENRNQILSQGDEIETWMWKRHAINAWKNRQRAQPPNAMQQIPQTMRQPQGQNVQVDNFGNLDSYGAKQANGIKSQQEGQLVVPASTPNMQNLSFEGMPGNQQLGFNANQRIQNPNTGATPAQIQQHQKNLVQTRVQQHQIQNTGINQPNNGSPLNMPARVNRPGSAMNTNNPSQAPRPPTRPQQNPAQIQPGAQQLQQAELKLFMEQMKAHGNTFTDQNQMTMVFQRWKLQQASRNMAAGMASQQHQQSPGFNPRSAPNMAKTPVPQDPSKQWEGQPNMQMQPQRLPDIGEYHYQRQQMGALPIPENVRTYNQLRNWIGANPQFGQHLERVNRMQVMHAQSLPKPGQGNRGNGMPQNRPSQAMNVNAASIPDPTPQQLQHVRSQVAQGMNISDAQLIGMWKMTQARNLANRMAASQPQPQQPPFAQNLQGPPQMMNVRQQTPNRPQKRPISEVEQTQGTQVPSTAQNLTILNICRDAAGLPQVTAAQVQGLDTSDRDGPHQTRYLEIQTMRKEELTRVLRTNMLNQQPAERANITQRLVELVRYMQQAEPLIARFYCKTRNEKLARRQLQLKYILEQQYKPGTQIPNDAFSLTFAELCNIQKEISEFVNMNKNNPNAQKQVTAENIQQMEEASRKSRIQQINSKNKPPPAPTTEKPPFPLGVPQQVLQQPNTTQYFGETRLSQSDLKLPNKKRKTTNGTPSSSAMPTPGSAGSPQIPKQASPIAKRKEARIACPEQGCTEAFATQADVEKHRASHKKVEKPITNPHEYLLEAVSHALGIGKAACDALVMEAKNEVEEREAAKQARKDGLQPPPTKAEVEQQAAMAEVQRQARKHTLYECGPDGAHAAPELVAKALGRSQMPTPPSPDEAWKASKIPRSVISDIFSKLDVAKEFAPKDIESSKLQAPWSTPTPTTKAESPTSKSARGSSPRSADMSMPEPDGLKIKMDPGEEKDLFGSTFHAHAPLKAENEFGFLDEDFNTSVMNGHYMEFGNDGGHLPMNSDDFSSMFNFENFLNSS